LADTGRDRRRRIACGFSFLDLLVAALRRRVGRELRAACRLVGLLRRTGRTGDDRIDGLWRLGDLAYGRNNQVLANLERCALAQTIGLADVRRLHAGLLGDAIERVARNDGVAA